MVKIYLDATISVNEEQIINSKLMGLLHEMNYLSFSLSESFMDIKNKSKQTVVIFRNNTNQNTISLMLLLSEQRILLLIKKIEELIINVKYDIQSNWRLKLTRHIDEPTNREIGIALAI